MWQLAVVVLVSGCDVVLGLRRIDDAGAPPAFDASACPSTYTIVSNGLASRYRFVKVARAVDLQAFDCRDDLPSGTHLVAIDSSFELGFLRSELDGMAEQALPSNRAWIGAVQLETATTPDDDWFSITGGSLLDAWNGGEPNDNFGTEDGEEQFVVVERGRNLIDAPGRDGYGAICECDGRDGDAELEPLFVP